jgi:FkbM family methyltransferase
LCWDVGIGKKLPSQLQRIKKLTQIVLRNGKRFEAPMIYWWDVDDVFFKHRYNPIQLPIGKNDVVVDIGANIGVFTVYAASITQNTVYAFEPSPSTFEVLKRNIGANGLSNVIAGMFAVSARRGTELFIETEDSTNRKLKAIAPNATEKCIEVSSITLQDIMDRNNIEQIDFLKLDCEGSEGLILESTSKDCLQRISKIAMEFHDGISKLKHSEMQYLLEAASFATDMHWNGKSTLGHLYAWRA